MSKTLSGFELVCPVDAEAFSAKSHGSMDNMCECANSLTFPIQLLLIHHFVTGWLTHTDLSNKSDFKRRRTSRRVMVVLAVHVHDLPFSPTLMKSMRTLIDSWFIFSILGPLYSTCSTKESC